MDLAEELGTGLSLSQSSLASSDALRPNPEAHSLASSGPVESMLLGHSSSEELDVTNEEFLDVMTRVTARLYLNWSVE